MKTVVIKVGPASAYHRPSPDGDRRPACYVEGHADEEVWREWPLKKAEAWREPCQYEACYGDGCANND